MADSLATKPLLAAAIPSGCLDIVILLSSQRHRLGRTV